MPHELKEGALALGTTRWEMVRGVMFPYARGGIAAALILGLGRAVGEAIAVTQVIGGGVFIHWNLFDGGDTLASKIAAEYQGATSNLQISSLVYLALILLVFSLLVNLLAQYDRAPRRAPAGHSAPPGEPPDELARDHAHRHPGRPAAAAARRQPADGVARLARRRGRGRDPRRRRLVGRTPRRGPAQPRPADEDAGRVQPHAGEAGPRERVRRLARDRRPRDRDGAARRDPRRRLPERVRPARRPVAASGSRSTC